MKKPPRFSKLRVENLEERTLLAVMAGGLETAVRTVAPTESATWVVNTLEDSWDWGIDDDVVSLREAIDRSADGDRIIFDESLTGGRIVLQGRDNRLEINHGITIDASGVGGITVDGNQKGGCFVIGSNDGPVELINLTITNGLEEHGGGAGISFLEGTLVLTNCTITDNFAYGNGGGICQSVHAYGSSLSLINCVVQGNRATDGAGVYQGSGNLTVTNCTITGNLAYGTGGGICDDYSFTTATVNNSIIALNSGNDIDYYNENGISGENNIIGSDPGFTVAPVFESGKLINRDEIDLTLAVNSPAINAGGNSCVTTETDLTGNPRIQFEIVDIGAYECQIEAPSTVVTTLEDVVDETDGLISLREAVNYAVEGDTVTFDSELAGGTIVLAGNEIMIDKGITIDAGNIGGITIDADGKSRLFFVGDYSYFPRADLTVMFICLTITNGYDSSGIGGGILNGGDLTLISCNVSRNTAEQRGGGIYTFGTLTLTNCTISKNFANMDGGGIYCSSDKQEIKITNCSISGNTAGNVGGGICDIFGSNVLTIANSILSGNSAGRIGGGIYNRDRGGKCLIANCTVSGNSAKEYGGGILDEGHLTIINSIVALNRADRVADYDNYGLGGSPYNNVIGFDPGFVIPPIFDESGQLTNFEELDLSLKAGSWAIDRGDNSFVETETDFAGNPRIYASWKEIPAVDIGAYEYQEKTVVKPAWVVTTTDDTIDDDDGQISLREAIQNAGNGETIIFDETLVGKAIELNGTSLGLSDKTISIDATSIGGITIDANGKSEVFFLQGSVLQTVEMIGLTITGGNTEEGAVICDNAGSLLVLTNCSIYGNTGCGIYDDGVGDWLVLTDCSIYGNSLSGIMDGNIILRNCSIHDNGGCGIISYGGPSSLSNCIISGNSCGGILKYGKLTITDSIISGNCGRDDGGGIFCAEGTLNITNSVISGNSAEEFGGGIYIEGYLSLTNCSVFGNTAVSGGGIYYDDYLPYIDRDDKLAVVITNTTIAGNSAQDKDSGGISLGAAINFNQIVANSIIALNYGSDVDYYPYGNILLVHNIVDSDPGFVTAPIFDEEGYLVNFNSLDLTLSAESPAIDAGDNSYVTTETDLAGKSRVINGIVDIGAYEYGSAPPAEQLASPTILTGNKGVYVSAGANRQQITWDAIENASGYELTYSTDGGTWTTVSVSETSAIVTGLTYGQDVKYRVRALGDGVSYTDSEWSEIKTFNVCPMDINNDGDIGGIDRVILAQSWLAEEGEDDFIPAADIDGNGDVGGIDRAFLANNWLNEVGVDDMIYPRPLASEMVLEIDGQPMSVLWEENESVAALRDLVSKEPLNIQMSMYGGFEQVGSIGARLPRNDVQTTTTAGDIVLYSGNQIVVFYGSNSWSYTRLGRISDRTADELTEILGSGDVSMTLTMT